MKTTQHPALGAPCLEPTRTSCHVNELPIAGQLGRPGHYHAQCTSKQASLRRSEVVSLSPVYGELRIETVKSCDSSACGMWNELKLCTMPRHAM